ncbi:hypothetical protein JOL62DRAFT_155924 [Phyllosticta paracitricarpa]|uniref:Uncharacterized protein n=1 Tax=Phyllosticta paracitricarpa TaxID=2016321 RepID=A0ABR1N3D3_9PEZI
MLPHNRRNTSNSWQWGMYQDSNSPDIPSRQQPPDPTSMHSNVLLLTDSGATCSCRLQGISSDKQDRSLAKAWNWSEYTEYARGHSLDGRLPRWRPGSVMPIFGQGHLRNDEGDDRGRAGRAPPPCHWKTRPRSRRLNHAAAFLFSFWTTAKVHVMSGTELSAAFFKASRIFFFFFFCEHRNPRGPCRHESGLQTPHGAAMHAIRSDLGQKRSACAERSDAGEGERIAGEERDSHA